MIRMKRIFVLLLLLVNWQWCSAQSCYPETRAQGIGLYNQKKFTDAIKCFEVARDCPDIPADNDLEDWIRKCRTARQQLEQETTRQRQEEERKRVAAADRGYMNIRDIEFANTGEDGTVLDNYGATMYASDVKYLKPRIVYDGLTKEIRKVTLYIKIYNPDGSLKTGSSSPAGYSYSDDIEVVSGSNHKTGLSGWGSNSGKSYVPGTYRCEIWYSKTKLFEKSFPLYKKSSEASYLQVDSKTALSTSFVSSGGTKTFYVNTDADSYETWGVPVWCRVSDKSASSFTLHCDANTSPSERTDYMKVKAGGKEVRIDIRQAADEKRKRATIESVWVDHNHFNGLIKGMLIHVKFSVDNMLSRQGECTAYFYFQNDQKLRDYNSSYCTVDGQVAVGQIFRPGYENALYNDFSLFMPYTELHVNTSAGTTYLKFCVQIQDKVTKEVLAQSNYVNFTIN